MGFVAKTAYDAGDKQAIAAFGITKEALLSQAWQVAKRALPSVLKGAKAITGNLPGAGAIAGGVLGGAQGLAMGEGAKGAFVRGAIGTGAGLVSSPVAGMAAQLGGDMLANKIMAPKGPPPAVNPGMLGGGHLSGMAM